MPPQKNFEICMLWDWISGHLNPKSRHCSTALHGLAARKAASGILRNVVVQPRKLVEPSRLERTVHRSTLTEGPRREGNVLRLKRRSPISSGLTAMIDHVCMQSGSRVWVPYGNETCVTFDLALVLRNVVRPWPHRPHRWLRPCSCGMWVFWSRKMVLHLNILKFVLW